MEKDAEKAVFAQGKLIPKNKFDLVKAGGGRALMLSRNDSSCVSSEIECACGTRGT